MTVLSIDTATQVCSVAIVRDGEVLAGRTEVAPQRHAELLLPFVDEVFSRAGCTPAECNAVAISIGPGSFTGLRIGLSVAKGIAFGTGKPIIPVPTPEAVAYHTARTKGEYNIVRVILPARREEYYVTQIACDGESPERLQKITVVTTTEAYNMIGDGAEDVFAGEGIVRLYRDLSVGKDDTDPVCARLRYSLDRDLHKTDASAVGFLAQNYKPSDPERLEPMYVKQFQSGSVSKKDTDISTR